MPDDSSLPEHLQLKHGRLPLAEAIITQQPVAVRRYVTEEVLVGLDRATINSVMDDMRDAMLVEMRAYVNTEHLADKTIPVKLRKRVVFETPRSWWQHFKRDVIGRTRIGPAVLRRWPVLLMPHFKVVDMKTSVVVEQFAVFPASPLKMPEKYRGNAVVRMERAHAYGGDLR